jgi:hypothetical protein
MLVNRPVRKKGRIENDTRSRTQNEPALPMAITDLLRAEPMERRRCPRTWLDRCPPLFARPCGCVGPDAPPGVHLVDEQLGGRDVLIQPEKFSGSYVRLSVLSRLYLTAPYA